MKRCTTCLREEKVFLDDLNCYKKTRKGTIRFKRCKNRISQFCIILMLDKIKIRL